MEGIKVPEDTHVNINYSIEDLYKTSFKIFIDNIVVCIANTLIACILSVLFGITVIGILCIPAIWGGYVSSMIRIVSGEKEEIGNFVKSGFNHWFGLLGATSIAYLGIFLGTCFFILPGLYLMVKWVFVTHYIVNENKSISEAFSSSSSLVSGPNFWPVVIVCIFNSIIGLIVGPLFIVSSPFVTLVLANYYVNLINSNDDVDVVNTQDKKKDEEK